MLATAARDEQDPRTIGALFFDCCDELEDIRYIDAMRLIIDLLNATLETADAHDKIVIEQILQQFISRLPNSIKGKLAA